MLAVVRIAIPLGNIVTPPIIAGKANGDEAKIAATPFVGANEISALVRGTDGGPNCYVEQRQRWSRSETLPPYRKERAPVMPYDVGVQPSDQRRNRCDTASETNDPLRLGIFQRMNLVQQAASPVLQLVGYGSDTCVFSFLNFCPGIVPFWASQIAGSIFRQELSSSSSSEHASS